MRRAATTRARAERKQRSERDTERASSADGATTKAGNHERGGGRAEDKTRSGHNVKYLERERPRASNGGLPAPNIFPLPLRFGISLTDQLHAPAVWLCLHELACRQNTNTDQRPIKQRFPKFHPRKIRKPTNERITNAINPSIHERKQTERTQEKRTKQFIQAVEKPRQMESRIAPQGQWEDRREAERTP